MLASLNHITSRVPGLKGDDALFLGQMMERFPRVHQGFTDFVSTDPRRRINKAAEVLEGQPRSGWDRLGVVHGRSDVLATHRGEYYGSRWLVFEANDTTGETVLRHSIELAELYALIFKEEPHVQLAVEVLKFHDFIEAINGDFTPRDPITRAEKGRLEKIALELLTESRTTGDLLALHIYNCMRIFEGEVTDFTPLRQQMLNSVNQQPSSRNKPFVQFVEGLYSRPSPDLVTLRIQAKDIDTVQMGARGLRIIRGNHFTVSEETALKKMDEFWSYINEKLSTHLCKVFFQQLSILYREDTEVPVQNVMMIAHAAMLNELDRQALLIAEHGPGVRLD